MGRSSYSHHTSLLPSSRQRKHVLEYHTGTTTSRTLADPSLLVWFVCTAPLRFFLPADFHSPASPLTPPPCIIILPQQGKKTRRSPILFPAAALHHHHHHHQHQHQREHQQHRHR